MGRGGPVDKIVPLPSYRPRICHNLAAKSRESFPIAFSSFIHLNFRRIFIGPLFIAPGRYCYLFELCLLTYRSPLIYVSTFVYLTQLHFAILNFKIYNTRNDHDNIRTLWYIISFIFQKLSSFSRNYRTEISNFISNVSNLTSNWNIHEKYFRAKIKILRKNIYTGSQ